MTDALLPTDSQERKAAPIYSGVLKYFPLALAAVARLSKIGNNKHNPGEPLHWSRDKSNDHGDGIVRHQLEAGTLDADGELHDVKVAWRALAQLQLAEEKRLAAAAAPKSEAPTVGAGQTEDCRDPSSVCKLGICGQKCRYGVTADALNREWVWDRALHGWKRTTA